MHALALGLSSIALYVACAGDAVAPRWSAVVDSGNVVVHDRLVDGPLVTVALDAIEVGVLDAAIVDEWNLDPWWLGSDDLLAVNAETPPGLVFGRPDELGVNVVATVEAVATDRFRVHLALVAPPDRRVAYLSLPLAVTGDEHFYGGGALHDRIELRGQRRAFQLEADLARESAYNERHVPVPLVLSTRGWAAFLATDRPLALDATRADRLTFTLAPGPADEAIADGSGGVDRAATGIDLWLFAADAPLDLLKPYYDTTGYPRTPPEWAHGPWYWRDEIAGQDAVLADFRAIRDHHLAASAYWIDRPYATALQTFDFAATYPDPAAMFAAAREAGLRMALWHTPYVTRDAADTYASAIDGGFFPPEQGLELNNFGSPPLDLTNPAAVAWWQDALVAYRALGVEGFKLDFAEDVVLGLPGPRSNRWRFADGRDERTMQHAYPALYHRTYREVLAAVGSDDDDPSGGFILARAGRWGGQQWVDAIWPGDLDADFATAKGGDDGRRVGGIPAALAYGLSLAASGYPCFAPDTGGYRHGPPDAEAYRRWFEMTAVSVVMQVGGGDNQVPWETERFGWDAGLLDDFRRYAALHLALFPYARALVDRIPLTGRPPVRPLGLQHPEHAADERADQYFFGDDLLVAPVVERGVSERAVFFPAGRWVDWWDGRARAVAVPGREMVPAPLGRLPLFLRAGAIVPLLDPAIETLAPADGSVVAGRLIVRVVPGPEPTALTLSDGTRFEVRSTRDGARLRWVRGGRWGPVTWEVLFGDGAPRVVEAPEGAIMVDQVETAGRDRSSGDVPRAWHKPEAGGGGRRLATDTITSPWAVSIFRSGTAHGDVNRTRSARAHHRRWCRPRRAGRRAPRRRGRGPG